MPNNKLLLLGIRMLLTEPRTVRRGLYNTSYLTELLEGEITPGRSRLIARLAMLELWLRMFEDREIDSYQLSLTDSP